MGFMYRLGFVGLFLAPTCAFAAALTPGNILIGISPNSDGYSTMAEYTPTGTLVQSWQRTSANPEMEGVAVDVNLTPYAYIGQGSTTIWSVNPVTSAYSTFNVLGLSMVGSTVEGQVSSYSHYLYLTDFNTGGSSTAPNGIVRYDLTTHAGQRFFDPFPGDPFGDSDFTKVTVGLNGKLYGLRDHGGYQSNDMIITDPTTMATPTVVTLPEEATALAVDSIGDYFVLRDGGIDEYSPSFQLLKTLALTNYTGVACNLNLSANGEIVATSNGGTVMLTTTSLSSYTSFSTTALVGKFDSIRQASAILIEPPGAPEPAFGGVLAAGAMWILSRRRRR